MGEQPADDAWIEKVVDIAGSLGFNKMRLRWKLLRWQESRRKARRWREQRMAHIGYQHKTCHECGAVQDRNEAICTRCGAKLTSRALQVLQRIGLTTPEFLSMSTVLVLVLIGVHLRVWLAAGNAAFSVPGQLLVDFGGRYPPLLSDEPWRLLTSIFLHAGLIHLGFNVLALATIGPRIEELYGRWTVLMLFVITGTLANLGSVAVGLTGVGIGASGGIMGLVGAAAGHGQRVGTSYGRTLRNDMLKWAAYTLLFGFWIHADNAAHALGFIAGAAFGYTVKPAAWNHPRLRVVRAIGKLIGAAAAIAALAIIFTRTPTPRPEPRQSPAAFDDDTDEEGLDSMVEICRMYYGGDRRAAMAAASPKGQELPPETIERVCDALYETREQCRTGNFGSGAAVERMREVQQRTCDQLRPLLSQLPERPAKPVPAESPPAERGSGEAGSAR